ncbi:MAG: amidase [Anaerolineae bacterium]|nr:amidase [Anaerolineae bacterium]
MDDLLFSSARAMARAIHRREVSSEELVSAHLKQIEKVNPAINAVVTLDAEHALAQARRADEAISRGETVGPLHGVPMTIKDSYDTAGVRTTAGTVGRRDFVPAEDATVVARLKGAGAILLGKTNTSEMTYSFEVENHVFGRTSNPYDTSRSSGGSSGGETAIIAAGGSPFGMGSDTGGSIRLPAHWCGVAGIRPSSGRVPRTGHVVGIGSTADSLTVVGPLARHAEDLPLLLAITSGPDGRDPSTAPVPLGNPASVNLAKLRVAAFTDDGWASPTPETAEAVKRAAQVLADAGAQVTEAVPPGVEKAFDLFVRVFESDGGFPGRQALRAAGTADADVTNHMDWVLEGRDPQPVSAEAYSMIIDEWDTFRRRMLAFMQGFDLIVCPVNAYPAMSHGFRHRDGGALMRNFSYTLAHNLTGYPGAVVRAGTSPEGLPIGVQLVAGWWRDDVALAAALAVEQATGGWVKPDISF